LNLTNETTTNITMTGLEPALSLSKGPEFSATLPGFAARSLVRYRIWAERRPLGSGSFEEVVAPRSDDPYRWRGYFVTPAPGWHQ
jgi:hypothetical protein